jgi:uncharacterized protein (TIGR00369 family)
MKVLPEHGKCYVCGGENPHSMGVRWFLRDDGGISTEIALTDSQQGPPGLAHGGASAALLDEAMGLSVWYAGHRVAAVNLNVNYHHPLPLGETITVSGRVCGKEGKAVHTAGEISLPGGEVAVSATGVYVEAPQLFTQAERWGQRGE